MPPGEISLEHTSGEPGAERITAGYVCISVIPHIFPFILLRHWDVSAIGLKLMLEEFAESVVFDAERMIQNRCNVVFSAK